MGLIQNLHNTAKQLQKTIVLPEADDERALRAAAQAGKLGFGPVVLLGDKDEINGRAKGFGFVEMNDRAEAEKAIAATNGTEMNGRPLRVNESQPKPPRSEGGGGYRGGNSRGGGGGRW